MKRVLTAMLLAMFTLGVVGCRGEVDVDDDDDLDRDYKKTETTIKKTDDGTKTTKTETKVDR
jgi:hypothetical protein